MAIANGCLFFYLAVKPYSMNKEKPPGTFSIQDFQSGDHKAYNAIYHQYYPALRFFANKLIQDEVASQDIAQETLIKLWEKHAGFSSPYAIKSFLYITARNACFNFLKRAQTGEKTEKEWSLRINDADDYVWNQLTRTEVVRKVQSMINALPTECGKIMQLSIVDGLQNHEIAELMKISVHTVKNQKARGVYLMKKKYGNNPLFLIALILLDMRTSHFESQTQPKEYASATVTTAHERIEDAAATYHLQPSVSGRHRQFLVKCASYTVWMLFFLKPLVQ